ncbi:DNA ligase 1 [Camelus ferus]|nr:DNA ligase 1 [Camelus ferus]
MQRSIMSFFQPKKEGKVKKPEETSNSTRETESPPKAALKERNRMVPEGDSPVKRPGRKVARVLGSEGEEEEEAPSPLKGQKPAPDSPQNSPPHPVTLPKSPSLSNTSPAVLSPPAIPKRRTARKQVPKRTFLEVLEEQSKDRVTEAKKKKEDKELETPSESLTEPEVGKKEEADAKEQPTMPPRPRETPEAEPLTESVCKPEMATKQGPQEDGQTQPPRPAAKTLSSFFCEFLLLTPSRKGGEVFVQRQESLLPSGRHLDPPSYNPAKNNYHPIEDACWQPGQKVPYLAVARTFEKIEEVSARLRMVETLSNLLRSVVALSPPDLLPVLYLSLNRLGPPQQGLELGIGDGILLKAVAQATGRQLESVRAEATEKGDVGLVAESSRSMQRLMLPPPALTAAGVFAKFRDIAQLAGNASTTKKMDIIKGLFVACRHSEARFIARAAEGRGGDAEFPPAVVDAGKGKTAEARKTWLEEQGMILKQTFCEVPDLDRIVPVLLAHGLEQLPEHCRLSPGIPLKPMLAHPTRGVGEVLKLFEEAAFTCEYKYDGQRAQIHLLEGGEVRIFSRNQEDNTGRYPDVISRVPKIKLPSVTSFILDTEAVAWDQEKKQIQPFQVLTTRKRKEVDAAEIQVQVCLYAFDLIYLNGESLVREPLSRRRQLLRENFVETEGEFVFATSLDTKDTEQIAEFLEQSVKDSCEGLMVKTLDTDATYEIAKRSHNWLKCSQPQLLFPLAQIPQGLVEKPQLGAPGPVVVALWMVAGGGLLGRVGAGGQELKKDYLDGVGDTLDLVVIGAYLGRGKRAGRYGGFLLASYDEESEELQAICKLGTGFSDEELEEHHQSLQALVLPAPRPYVRADGAVTPDHWLDPSAVWEVKCADLSLSPIYPAARGLFPMGPACIFLRKGIAEKHRERPLGPDEIEVGGRVDFDDFVELMAPKLLAETAGMIGVQEMRDAFKEFDANGDGAITLVELQQAMQRLLGDKLTPQEISEIVQEADVNGDGTVDFEGDVVWPRPQWESTSISPV